MDLGKALSTTMMNTIKVITAYALLLLMFTMSHLAHAQSEDSELPYITSPVAGDTINEGTVSITWTGNALTNDITRYLIRVGSTPGASDYHGGIYFTNLNATITGLPNDGSTIYIQLWYKTAAGWNSIAPTAFSTSAVLLPEIISPVAGSTLSDNTATITWTGNSLADEISRYLIRVGSTPGGSEYHGGIYFTNLAANITGLPNDGSTVYVQLWYKTTTGWNSIDPNAYTASGVSLPEIISPVAGSTLNYGTTTITWTGNSLSDDITRYIIRVGSTPGASDYHGGIYFTNLSATINNLPNDGSTIYIQLWYKTETGWNAIDPSAYIASEILLPELISPVAGSTLDNNTTTITWAGNSLSSDITRYLIRVGSTPGATDYHGGVYFSNLSATVTDLPNDGSKIYIQLWYKTETGWNSVPSVAYTASTVATTPNLSEYELVFSDEFNSTTLDPTKWQTSFLWGPYLPINGEEQLYVDILGINQDFAQSPFTFDGEHLTITATPTSSTLQPPARPPQDSSLYDAYPEYQFNGATDSNEGYQPDNVNYLSGIITSYDAFKMTHGYVEARVKLPAGRGLWPAFWLLNSHYVEDSPEIDIMEFLGQDTDRVYHTYHYYEPENNYAGISTPSFTTLAEDWTQEFHTFGLAWSPNDIVWYVDGQETRRITNSEYTISKQAMYLIANLAVGGSWPGSPDTTTLFPAEYKLDYIRAYKHKLSEPLSLAADYQLVFSDEFNSDTLDTEKWNTSFLWGPFYTINNEEQYYVDTNGIDSDQTYSPFSFSTENSTQFMSINARSSADSDSQLPPTELPNSNSGIWTENPEFQQGPYPEPKSYTSGIITSYDSFKFINGYAEIRARVPEGDGLWPAFWLLNAYYVGPLPEIDIMEILGEDPSKAYHTFHRSDTNGAQLANQYTSSTSDNVNGYSDDFHEFGVRWRPGEITWYVDGEIVGNYTEENPDDNDAYQLMYVIANLAVGGNFNSQPVDASKIPASFDIDYIRVYQENDTP